MKNTRQMEPGACPLISATNSTDFKTNRIECRRGQSNRVRWQASRVQITLNEAAVDLRLRRLLCGKAAPYRGHSVRDNRLRAGTCRILFRLEASAIFVYAVKHRKEG